MCRPARFPQRAISLSNTGTRVDEAFREAYHRRFPQKRELRGFVLRELGFDRRQLVEVGIRLWQGRDMRLFASEWKPMTMQS